MGRVAGRVRDLEALDGLAALQSPQPVLGHRHELAPEPVHVVAVELGGALEQLRGIHHVRRSALVHVDHELREALRERAGGARVVEVDVRQQEGAGHGLAEHLEQRVEARSGPGIDDHAVHLVRADHAVVPEVLDVNCAAHGGPEHTIPGVSESEHRLPEPDRPWVMRTYAGHSTARESNELYRKNLSRRARPACRSPSTSPPRPATTPTTSCHAARSARSASRSPTRATCTRCSTASRSTR